MNILQRFKYVAGTALAEQPHYQQSSLGLRS